MVRITGVGKIYMDLFKRHSLRGFRYQNLDFAWPHHRNMYWPTKRTVEGDVCLFLEAFVRVFDSWIFWDSSCGRDLNYQVMLMQISYHNTPTRLSRLATWIYRFRRRGPEYAVSWYYRRDNKKVGEEISKAVKRHLLN